MKQRNIIIIGGLLCAFTAVALFVWYKISESTECSLQQNVIVLWNNTGKTIDIELRFSYLKPKYLEIARGVRACIPLISDQKFESWDSLKYVVIGYGKHKYKFTKSECLNNAQPTSGGRSVRYFMVASVSVNDEVWEKVKRNYVEKDKTLDEDYSFLVLSSYAKKSSPWGTHACMQALKYKRLKA